VLPSSLSEVSGQLTLSTDAITVAVGIEVERLPLV
jgi:hypothetical protein